MMKVFVHQSCLYLNITTVIWNLVNKLKTKRMNDRARAVSFSFSFTIRGVCLSKSINKSTDGASQHYKSKLLGVREVLFKLLVLVC